jgi:hypothetical protein
MEYPGSWDLLVSSLSVCGLEQPDRAWTFLLRQGLVRDAPGDHAAFADFVRRETDLGHITGLSISKRVAIALETAGIALPAGRVPDPFGATARERLKG